jgi:branched-chain amino acid transport system permease protein
LAIVLCFGVCIAGSLVLQVAVFRPLRGASPLTTLIVTFGVSYGLEALWLIVFGPNGNTVSMLTNLNDTVIGGAVALRWITLVEIGAAAVLFGGLYLVLFRSSLGLKMRAVAEDFRAARIVGVRIERVVTWAFVLSGASAAVVAVLATVQSPLVTPSFGLSLVIVALVGVVLGGIDRLGRATAGGFVVGFVNSLLGSVLPEQQLVFVTSLTFLFVIVALVLRPACLLAQGDRAAVHLHPATFPLPPRRRPLPCEAAAPQQEAREVWPRRWLRFLIHPLLVPPVEKLSQGRLGWPRPLYRWQVI